MFTHRVVSPHEISELSVLMLRSKPDSVIGYTPKSTNDVEFKPSSAFCEPFVRSAIHFESNESTERSYTRAAVDHVRMKPQSCGQTHFVELAEETKSRCRSSISIFANYRVRRVLSRNNMHCVIPRNLNELLKVSQSTSAPHGNMYV